MKKTNIFIKLSFKNKELIKKSNNCGCYYCKSMLKPSEVKYMEEIDGYYTAICPNCGIDSVLDDKSVENFQEELNEEFLERLNKKAFNK